MRKFSINLEDEVVKKLDDFLEKERKRSGVRVSRGAMISGLVRTAVERLLGEESK